MTERDEAFLYADGLMAAADPGPSAVFERVAIRRLLVLAYIEGKQAGIRSVIATEAERDDALEAIASRRASRA